MCASNPHKILKQIHIIVSHQAGIYKILHVNIPGLRQENPGFAQNRILYQKQDAV